LGTVRELQSYPFQLEESFRRIEAPGSRAIMFNSANTQNMPVSGQLDEHQRLTAYPFVDWRLRYQMIEIDWRIEMLRSQEYSRLLLGENYHRTLLPALPAPEGESQSAAQAALLRPPVPAPVPQPDDGRIGHLGGTMATQQRCLVSSYFVCLLPHGSYHLTDRRRAIAQRPP